MIKGNNKNLGLGPWVVWLGSNGLQLVDPSLTHPTQPTQWIELVFRGLMGGVGFFFILSLGFVGFKLETFLIWPNSHY